MRYIAEEYLDSQLQIASIDDWHYTIKSDINLWKGKEKFLAEKLNSVLFENGINYVIDVQLVPQSEEAFVLDLGKHYIRPYYMIVVYDHHYKQFRKECNVYESKAAARMQVLEQITGLDATDDIILSQIESFFRTGSWKRDNDYYLISILPEMRLKSGDCLKIDKLSDITAGNSDSPYTSKVQFVHVYQYGNAQQDESFCYETDLNQCIFKVDLKSRRRED